MDFPFSSGILFLLEGNGNFASKILAVSRCGDLIVSFKPPKAAIFFRGKHD